MSYPSQANASQRQCRVFRPWVARRPPTPPLLQGGKQASGRKAECRKTVLLVGKARVNTTLNFQGEGRSAKG